MNVKIFKRMLRELFVLVVSFILLQLFLAATKYLFGEHAIWFNTGTFLVLAYYVCKSMVETEETL